MNEIKVWHNPRCAKSREALSIIEENGLECDVVKYLDSTPDANEIRNTLKLLNLSARELMRTKEAVYKELNLKEETDEDKLIEAMAQNPKLIERPVLFKGDKAIIGRPSSVIVEFLKD